MDALGSALLAMGEREQIRASSDSHLCIPAAPPLFCCATGGFTLRMRPHEFFPSPHSRRFRRRVHRVDLFLRNASRRRAIATRGRSNAPGRLVARARRFAHAG